MSDVERAKLIADLGPFEAARRLMQPVDVGAAASATERLSSLATPPGAIEAVADVAVRLAAIAGTLDIVVDPAVVAVFAGDHGVVASGVTEWPSSITAAMVVQFCTGRATVNAFARAAGASVVAVDVGVAESLPPDLPGLVSARVRSGTRDLATGPALTTDEVVAALDVGARVAFDLVADGARCLLTGDMGIGNTTPSAAIIAALTGCGAEQATGLGTGIGPDVLARKTEIVATAVGRLEGNQDPHAVLAEVGGLEHAALAGFVVAAASLRVPVIADGVISLAGVLLAERLAPGAADAVVAGHRSPEPAATIALDVLRLRPLLELDLRLGEGSGAVLALPIVRAAASILTDVATIPEVLGTPPGDV